MESHDHQKNLRSFECPCKEGFHIVDISVKEWAIVADQIKELGDKMKITITGTQKSYLVPRIYIAVHGIRAIDLPKLGFKEI